MGGSSELTGPDLTKGVAVAQLAEGATLVGQANGEAVLVARSGGELFAVGASCTHYGGALVDGIIVGDTVRCPLHHACFSLRSGEAVRAPALNPVACFDVEQRDGKLFVLGKREPATKRSPAKNPASVVIVGAGAAGNAAAEMLRREAYSGPITLLGEEPTPPCDMPNLSKDYLAGTAPEEWIPLRGAEFYEEQKIALRTSARVERIDVAAHRVVLTGGEAIPYGALLLATGARPNRLSVPGADLPHVFTLRSLNDSRAIIARCGSAKRAVVIGASFIGLEVAASLRARGLEVHVVAPEARPLERVMGPELGDFIRGLHEEHGVVFHLSDGVTSIDAAKVTLKTGSSLEADLVVTGIGVRPNLQLCEAAGLSIDRGVLVDEHLRTSAADVWAAGDIARWPDPRTKERIRVEHWVVAERHGQIAARNILGQNVVCDVVPFFWSQHYDVAVDYVGHAARWDRIERSGDLGARTATFTFRQGELTLAVATIGRNRESLQAEHALETGDAK
jgi:NADPH-dependent 2,4-dienoyl-CoA reductase/sulfur reductase-like enzyme/nitrite reductase/ring-hydroxylating ferredoxin subunit